MVLKLDALDKQLLHLLQGNCKKTTKEYGLSLGLSTTAVYERIRRLERAGFIERYVALVDKTSVHKNLTVFCQIKLIQHSRDNIHQFEKEILKLEEVVEVYHLSGDYDYVIKLHVADMEAYRTFMVNKLTAIQHIGSTQSSFAIKEVKHTTALSLN